MDWLPSDRDFLKALEPLGYKQPASHATSLTGTAKKSCASKRPPAFTQKESSGIGKSAGTGVLNGGGDEAVLLTPVKRGRSGTGSGDGAAACALPLMNLRLLLQCFTAVVRRDEVQLRT